MESRSRAGIVRSLSRKRILIRSASLQEESHSKDFDYESAFECMMRTKRHCGEKEEDIICLDKPVLESLPQELLVKIICGVNHDDLKQLFLVSKSFNQATKIAKESHFAFATPSKVPVSRFSNRFPIITGELNSSSEDEKAPNAPLRKARRSCVTDEKRKELADITVALFRSDSEDLEGERWPRIKLFKN